jgi:hypothetical protein
MHLAQYRNTLEQSANPFKKTLNSRHRKDRKSFSCPHSTLFLLIRPSIKVVAVALIKATSWCGSRVEGRTSLSGTKAVSSAGSTWRELPRYACLNFHPSPSLSGPRPNKNYVSLFVPMPPCPPPFLLRFPTQPPLCAPSPLPRLWGLDSGRTPASIL